MTQLTQVSEHGDVRAWAKQCVAACHRANMPLEATIWRVVAERGEDYPPGELPLSVPLGPPHACFREAALAVITADADEGLCYAEGFALSEFDMWVHHAWVITGDGHAVDLTWEHPGKRYIGVTVPVGKTSARLGCSLLAPISLGFIWGPDLVGNPGKFV